MNEKINFDDLVPKLDDEAFDTGLPTVEEATSPNENNEVEETEETVQTEQSQVNTDSVDTDVDTPKSEEVSTEKSEPEVNEAATLFYQELVNQGIATEDSEKEEYSWDDVSGVINNYKEELPKQITEQLIDSAPDLGKDLIDYVFTKGQDLKPEDLNEFMSQYISDIQDQNTEFNDVEKARDYLSNKYTDQGIRKSQIEVMLDALEDEGDDAVFEEAKKFKTKDVENSKSKQMLNQSKEQTQQRQQQQQQFAQSLMEELTNTGWKQQRIQRVQQDLSTGKTNELLSKAGNSPKALIQLANLATYFDEKSGQFNFDDFIKQAVSKDATSLKDKITKDMFSTGTTTKEKSSNPNKKAYSDLVPISPIN